MLDDSLPIDKVEPIECLESFMVGVFHFKCPNYEVSLYVRTEIFDEFVEFVRPMMDKFMSRVAVIYGNRYQDDMYRVEDAKHAVTAMKFRNKDHNSRVYCREIKTGYGKQVIICAIHYDKKNQKNQHKENNIIKKVAGYEFQICS